MKKKIWDCKIGEIDPLKLPKGADGPMRKAIEKAYYDLTGEWPDFVFSGWGAELTEGERRVIEESDEDLDTRRSKLMNRR